MEQGGLSVCNVHLNTSLRKEEREGDGRGGEGSAVSESPPSYNTEIDQVKEIWVIFISSDYLASNSLYLQCTYMDALAKG